MSDVESWFVKSVTAHPATDGIANELLDDYVIMPNDIVVLYGDFTLLEDSDFFKWHVWCEFILKSVDFYELAVQLFLVGVKLIEETGLFGFVVIEEFS